MKKFDKIFWFFYKVYRRKIILFCGEEIKIEFSFNGKDAKKCFKDFENGLYKNKVIKTKHPRLLKAVLIAKKGWGLWVDQWSSGIVENTFTKNEILEDFISNNIQIPIGLFTEFNNLIDKKRKSKVII